MPMRSILFKELIKNGHAESNGSKVWDISRRYLRYINPEMAKAFLKIMEHPRYKATIIDIELRLLKENIAKFFKDIGEAPFNLIDMSCTDGSKITTIANSLPKNFKMRYCPVSVNEYLVNLSLNNVKSKNFGNIIDYAPRLAKDFESLDEIGAALRNSTYQRNVLLLLSSFLSSFDINDYLFRLSQSMLPGDILIIGNGIRKGERFVNLETYENPIFNDWLIHLMKQLGFNENEVSYNARFANNRLEAYYKVNKDKALIYENKKLNFSKGDEIIVAFQHKLYAKELNTFCDMYFDKIKLVKDKDEEYSLVFCTK